MTRLSPRTQRRVFDKINLSKAAFTAQTAGQVTPSLGCSKMMNAHNNSSVLKILKTSG